MVNLLLPLLVSIPSVVYLTGSVLDGQQKTRDQSGGLVWVSQSDISSNLYKVIVFLLAIWVFSLFVNKSSVSKPKEPSQLSLYLWLTALLLGALQGLNLANFFDYFVASAVLFLPRLVGNLNFHHSVSMAGRVGNFLLILNLLYSFTYTNRGLSECRIEKCTPLGRVLNGFFPQENTLAMYAFTILVFVLLTGDGKYFILRMVPSISVILFTGSRVAILAVLVILVVYFLLCKARIQGILQFMGIATIGLYLLSTFAFFFPSVFGDLTGRREIWMLLNRVFWTEPFLGPGRETLYTMYASSQGLNYPVAHEHSQGGYILFNAGFIGAILFLIFLIAVVNLTYRREISKRQTQTMFALFATSLFFITEPAFELSLKAPMFALLVTVTWGATHHTLIRPKSTK